MRKHFTNRCRIVLLGLLPFAAHAVPYTGTAYEPFDYGTVVDASNPATDSNLNLNSRGAGWNASGDPALPNTTIWGNGVTTAPFVVTNTTVVAGTLPGLAPAVGNRIQVNAGTAGRSLGQTVDSASLYFSFTVQRLTDSIRTINFALFAGTVEKFGFGQYATAAVAATSGGNLAAVFLNTNPGNLVIGSGGVTPIPMGTGVPHQVIIRIDFDTSGVNDRVRVYVDPASLADENALTPYVDNENFDMGAITTLRPFSGGATTTPVALAAGSGTFDEIRVGATFSAVTARLVPDLNIAGTNDAVTVSWPSSFSWCFLQQNVALSTGPWAAAEGVEDNGTLKSLTVPSPAGHLFCRLAQP